MSRNFQILEGKFGNYMFSIQFQKASYHETQSEEFLYFYSKAVAVVWQIIQP